MICPSSSCMTNVRLPWMMPNEPQCIVAAVSPLSIPWPPALAEVYFNPFVVDVVVDGTGGVRPSTDTSHQVVRIIASFFFQELFLDFTADDALQAGHHVGIGVWPYGGTDDVEGVLRMTAPVADGLIRGIFQCFVTTFYRINLGTQHFHAFYVDVLPCHVRRSHVDSARHVHQGADRSGGHTVLPGTGLGNDTRFAHFPC